ncbi:hypothetical protein CSV69_12175 [Sporosarcina sp. P26b]|uniref:CapA family protein n=1 Tax=Sporosarcina sp. P26b TaxID=2048253 RepID=UPI000C167BD3|nr:CapA family protein [Sporosarcina sp. P26b]PIC95355.1 hypothetical protein CSV69_12175 [Sporosarcina sp. P26b]
MRKWLVASLVFVWTVGGIILWSDWNTREYGLTSEKKSTVTNSVAKDTTEKVTEVKAEQKVEETISTTATIGMIGDVLLHNPIYTYPNFDFAFEEIKDKTASIDFLLANQESMPAGVELGLSTYPKFNSPKHILPALQKIGVDMVTFANNHTFDKGEAGVRKSIEHANEYGLEYVGAYESFKDRKTQRIVEVNGIKIGVLAYTYGTNVELDLHDKEYLVNYIDRERMENEIKEMKPMVDVTIVSLHWGPEYHLETSEDQAELAQFVSDAGADVLFGHHPHVLQRYGEVGNTKVFFSLGNFYSAQPFDYTNFGGIAKLSVTKEQTGDQKTVTIEDPRFFPTGVIRDQDRRFKVVPLSKANPTIKYNDEWVENHVGVPKW